MPGQQFQRGFAPGFDRHKAFADKTFLCEAVAVHRGIVSPVAVHEFRRLVVVGDEADPAVAESDQVFSGFAPPGQIVHCDCVFAEFGKVIHHLNHRDSDRFQVLRQFQLMPLRVQDDAVHIALHQPREHPALPVCIEIQ